VKLAVVGHVEWLEFVRVEAVPRPGEIVSAQETWEEPAGGGGVAAVELARLAVEAALYCLLGADELGVQARIRLEAAGVRVHSPPTDESQRRGFCYLDGVGERTITVIGEKPRPKGGEGALPWEELDESDGVYFTAGDAEAVRQARRARVLVATARELPTLHAAGVELDALVASGEDEAERYQAGDLEPPPKLVVSTAGSLGGWAQPGGPYKAAAPPGAYEDNYGAGDCFAAGLTFALAKGLDVPEALVFASERGALALTRRGAGLGAPNAMKL
jgi:ribokinase